MRALYQALNKPIDAFKAKNKATAWALVALTILVNTVLEPLMQTFARTKPIDPLRMLTATLLGVVTYIVICGAFWLIGKALGSKMTLTGHIETWGLTYFPTLFCSFVVAITEVFFDVFWNSVFWGMVFSVLFVGILSWKTVLYILYLREAAGLRRGKLVGAFIAIGICVVLLAMANGYFGIKTPIL